MLSPTRFFSLAVCLALGMSATSAFGQDFPTRAAHHDRLEALVRQHTAHAEAIPLGRSAGGHPLHAYAVGTGERHNKPALLVIGGVERNDLTSPLAAEAFLNMLLTSGADSVRTLRERFTVYVIPRLSPDPLEGFHATPRVVALGNAARMDHDRDGQVAEDGPSDLNGDRLISWMRVTHPEGTYLAHPEEPFLLRPADASKGEVGRFMLMQEGRDDDGDGRVNEDPAFGIDVNRNTTHRYAAYAPFAGAFPFEAPELRALGDFVMARPNIVAVFTFSEHDNLHHPWRVRHPVRPPSAPNRFQADSIAYSMTVRQIAPLVRYAGVEAVPSGSIPGWAYFHAGRFSFTAPVFTYPADSTQTRPAPIKTSLDRQHRAYRWLQANRPDLVLAWTPIEHPDFPGRTVELGGMAPFAAANPMQESMMAEAISAPLPLLFSLASRLPRLEVGAPRVEALGGNVFRVTVPMHNAGQLPTHAEAGRAVVAQRPLRVDVNLQNGQTLLSGRAITLVQDPIPGGATHELTYVIAGQGTIQVTAGSPSAGFARTSVRLP